MSKTKRHERLQRDGAANTLPLPSTTSMPTAMDAAPATDAGVAQQVMSMMRHLTRDAYSNPLARQGYGTASLGEATQYPLTRLTRNYMLMVSLYRSHWLVRRIIDTIPEDMLKNGWSISSQLAPELIDRLERAQERTQLVAKLSEGLKWGRLFGGAAALMLIDGHGGMLDKPLRLDEVMPGSFHGLLVMDRWSGICPGPTLVTDMSDSQYGLPDSYQVTLNATSQVIANVHHSRILRFIGRDLPQWERQAEVYWGASEVEHFYDDMRRRDDAANSIGSLLFSANIKVLGMEGITQMLVGANAQAQQNLLNLMTAMNDMMSSNAMLVRDSTTTFDTHQYTFSGLSDIYHELFADVAGASQIPMTRLRGESPGGLNATGDSDLQHYYELVAGLQNSQLKPLLNQVMPVLVVSELGHIPDDFATTFNPVRTVDDKDRAELGAKNTESVIAAYNAGLVGRRTAMKELRQQKDITGLWTNISDEDIAAADDEPQGAGEAMPDLGMLGGLTGGEQQPVGTPTAH
jgi:phage-related protein (TIGR01555 family)